ncbi:unnamed protein product, partial [Closterium sp. NIES-53]
CRAALQLLALSAPLTSRPAAACESRPTALTSVRRPALQPAPSCPAACASRCPALRPARRPALQPSASRPAALSSARPIVLRVAPCCSPRIAPYCPARRALLQPTSRALLLRASRSAAARTSRTAALCIAPCCPAQRAPCCHVHRAPCPAGRGVPSPPSRPTTTAAACATADAGGGAGGSAGGAAGAGGAGGATGSAGGAASARGAGPTTDRHCLSWPLSRQLQQLGVDSSGGGGFGFLRTAQRRQQSQQETFSPQLLSELVSQRCVTGFVEAAALGASESAAALGASESAAAPGASESAAVLGASESAAASGASESAAASGARASTATVSLADPTGGPVVARTSAVLPCPAVRSGSLSGLHLPTFSTNLVSNAATQDVWVDTFIPGGQRVAICTCSRTGHHLATFSRRPGSNLYTLTTASAQVAVSSQVFASGQLAASFSCRVLSHQTLLRHHHLSHPSLLCLCNMHSRLLVFGLHRSLPSLPRSPALFYLPCVEGRQRAAPHSSEFPPTTTPLQTLHMDVWGTAPVGGTAQKHYFLLVV